MANKSFCFGRLCDAPMAQQNELYSKMFSNKKSGANNCCEKKWASFKCFIWYSCDQGEKTEIFGQQYPRDMFSVSLLHGI